MGRGAWILLGAALPYAAVSVLVVAQPKSGSTSLMQTLAKLGGKKGTQEMGHALGTVTSHACKQNATLARTLIESLAREAAERSTRFGNLSLDFSPLLESHGSKCAERYPTFFSKAHGSPFSRHTCFRVLPHSDMRELYEKTLEHWLTSRTVLYKQHILPTEHNLELFARAIKREPGDSQFALLVRDPVKSAIAYVFDTAKPSPRDPFHHSRDPCLIFGQARALHEWREKWVAFAEAHTRWVTVVDYEDLYGINDQDRCVSLERVLGHLAMNKAAAELESDENCHQTQMAKARFSHKNKIPATKARSPHKNTTLPLHKPPAPRQAAPKHAQKAKPRQGTRRTRRATHHDNNSLIRRMTSRRSRR